MVSKLYHTHNKYMTFYVVDTTINPPQLRQFPEYSQIVKYLEGMTQRAHKQTRKDRMIMLSELGYGYDDPDSVSFVRSMADIFDMGIIRNAAGQLRKIRCDITTVSLYQKEEFGN